MIRVTTIYAASAGASARYYTGYLTEPDGELPGRWTGRNPSADDRGRIIALANATLLARHNLHGDDERRLVGDLLAAS